MKLAVLCPDVGDVDIIENVPDMNADDIEEYLSVELNYNTDNICWMDLSHGRVNYLTPEDFG